MRALWISAIVFLVPASARAQADPVSLPAHDRHEGLLVAADPYTDATRAKERFGKANPLDAGILPIEIFFRNETDKPMRIKLHTIRLEIEPPGAPHQQLEVLTADDVAGRIAHPGGTPNPETARHRVPRPIPMPSHDKKQEKLAAILHPLELGSDVVAPSATVHGFIFFDLNHDFSLLANASLYVPDVRPIGAGQPLTYFEVGLRATARH